MRIQVLIDGKLALEGEASFDGSSDGTTEWIVTRESDGWQFLVQVPSPLEEDTVDDESK